MKDPDLLDHLDTSLYKQSSFAVSNWSESAKE